MLVIVRRTSTQALALTGDNMKKGYLRSVACRLSMVSAMPSNFASVAKCVKAGPVMEMTTCGW